MRNLETLGLSFLGLALAGALLQGCSQPQGPDLIEVQCICFDECTGLNLSISGVVCGDGSTDESARDAADFLCRKKETLGINVCKIKQCGVVSYQVIPKGCPEDSGEFYSGDFGQALAHAVDPSVVHVSGDDIHSFSIAPEEFTAQTTQEGSILHFADPFSVALESDGTYVIPAGAAKFVTTGLLDGDRVSLLVKSVNLTGIYDEEAGLFDMGGTVQAEGADVSFTVDLVFQFDSRPPRANAGPDQVVECSSNGLTGNVHLSGAESFDLDGEADIIQFSWHIDPGTPGETTVAGEEVDVDLGLGLHLVTLSVADRRGSHGEDSATVLVQDTSPPVISIQQPATGTYVHSATLTLDYTVADVCTGVREFTVLLDGAPTLAGHGLESGQAIPLLTELALGTHTFSISAVDQIGNAGSATAVFEIIVTAESILESVRQFLEGGQITLDDGSSLLSKLKAAAAARAEGKCKLADLIYQSFIRELEAQRGKKVDPGAADILIADAEYLIAHCP